jgi:sugar/nucleoside kinase (ribokinase family)
VSIVVTGSIASDYLMTFPGRFREQLIDGQLDHVSLSFLVDDLHIYRGGVGGNLAFGLGRLGVPSSLVGAVGADFGEYRQWLESHGVDCDHVHVSDTRHTARFLCTTDADSDQIASFYAGAMTEAGGIELGAVLAAIPDADLVVVAPNDRWRWSGTPRPAARPASGSDLEPVDPTGVGDACRAGFLAGLERGLGMRRSAEIGCTLASFVLESVGTQEYTFAADDFASRVAWTYGADAATDVRAFLGAVRRTDPEETA